MAKKAKGNRVQVILECTEHKLCLEHLGFESLMTPTLKYEHCSMLKVRASFKLT